MAVGNGKCQQMSVANPSLNPLAGMHPFAFVASFLVVFCITLTLSRLVNDAQPTPYMDEVFHVPQARNYCVYNLTHWDPMITTPPGLYLASLAWIRVAREQCSVSALRFTNVLFTLGNLWLSCLVSIRLHESPPSRTRVKLVVSGSVLTLLPVLYFFSFLYYTDPGTVFFLQLAYLYELFEHHWLAALFGAVAVLFRQTSIAWVFMLACCRVVSILDDLPCKTFCDVTASGKRIVRDCFGYAVVGLAFVAFLMFNGSIVLGDRRAHEPCLHVAQLGYFLLFTLFHGAPYLLTPTILKDFFRSLRRNPAAYVAAFAVAVAAAGKLSYVHPYLLADNRHLTFYLWRRLLSKTGAARYALISASLYAGYALSRCLRHKSLPWRILFCVALVASTVPQRLLELRYFVVPYVFFRLNVKAPGYAQLILEATLYCAVNAIVLYLFLRRTFFWKDSSEPQRFLW